MTVEEYKKAYLDYWNNHVTVEGYADKNLITVEKAELIIKTGKHFYNKECQKLKERQIEK